MSNFARLVTEDRRLVILRFLDEMPRRELNTSVLQSTLDAFGHAVSRDQVATDCAWLGEQGMVDVETVGPVTVVSLTARGEDVARGRVVQPGVKRPSPRS